MAATDRIVAVAGVHPYIALLEAGADVIIGGCSSDCAIFAAPAIRAGFPQGLAYYYGKILECASFCAEPYAGKESVLGEITMDDVKVTAMFPAQRCTVPSVAGHAMYERANPFTEYVLGGRLDMSNRVYEQYDERTCRITGPQFVPAEELRVKLEGSGKVGERFVGMVGGPRSLRPDGIVLNRGDHGGRPGMTVRPAERLFDLAKTIRSKNAGVDRITFDIMFTDREIYERVRRSGVLSRDAICRIFGIAAGRITDRVEFDATLAIKFTIRRSIASGSPGGGDIFGSQQYGALLYLVIPP